MPKFHKRPIVIEAEQYHAGVVPSVPGVKVDSPEVAEIRPLGQALAFIDTLEGRMEVSPGDWIIKGVAGELYPCKPDIFERTYEAADAKGLDWRQDDGPEIRAASVYHDDGSPLDYVIEYGGKEWMLTFEGDGMATGSLAACMAQAEADHAKSAEFLLTDKEPVT